MTTLYKNPYYLTQSPKWTLWDDLYQGDHSTLVTKYLFRHENEKKPEGADLLKTRQERTRYLNLQEISISILRSLFFLKPGAADEALIALAGDDLKDIDREGRSLDTFISDVVFSNYINLGAVCVIADAPRGGAVNAEEETTKGLRPFLKSIHPLNVHDWVFEKRDHSRLNRLNMLRYVYLEELPRSDTDEPVRRLYSDSYVRTEGGIVLKRYQGAEFKQYDMPTDRQTADGWQLIEEIPLAQQEIPGVLWFGQSWMKDAAQEIIRHFNLRSALDNVNYYQGYQKLFVKGGTNMSDDQRKALAEYIMGLLSEGQDIISIDAIDPVGLEKAVAQAREDALRAALNQLRTLPGDSREAMGAEASVEQRRDTTNLVREALGELEDIVTKAVQAYATFKDRTYLTKQFEGRFILNKDVTDQSITELISAIPMLSQQFASNPEWELAHMRRIIAALDYSQEETQKITESLQPSRAQTGAAQRENLLGGIFGG
jgi:hypothetical protein